MSAIIANMRRRNGGIQNPRSKYQLLTIWEPEGGFGDVEQFFAVANVAEHCEYVGWQLERAPDTGRLHIQAIVIFKERGGVRAAMERLGLPQSAYHAKLVTNNHERARAYCRKLDTRVGESAYEWGTWYQPGIGDGGERTTSGTRSDLLFAGAFLRDGGKLEQLAKLRPDIVIKFHKGLEATKHLLDERGARRERRRLVFVLCGPTGTGKTSGVHARFGKSEVFRPPIRQGEAFWWDGLEEQPVLLLDEFHGDVKYQALKRLIDPWYNEMAPVKGRHALMACDYVFIASNLMPWQWWEWKEFNVNMFPELDRRVTKWVWFGEIKDKPDAGIGGMNINWIHKDVFNWNSLEQYTLNV